MTEHERVETVLRHHPAGKCRKFVTIQTSRMPPWDMPVQTDLSTLAGLLHRPAFLTCLLGRATSSACKTKMNRNMPGLHHLAANIQIKYEDILLHFLFGHTVSTVIPCPELSYLIVRILWLTMLASLDGFQTLLLNEFNALRINRKFFITMYIRKRPSIAILICTYSSQCNANRCHAHSTLVPFQSYQHIFLA